MTKRALTLAVFFLLFVRPAYADLQVFATFEDPAEIAAVKASPGTQIAASKRFPAWGGNRDIVNSAGNVRFRTALNDSVSTWRVAVTEVISGETAQVEIMIQ
jgi:hypothetical protein